MRRSAPTIVKVIAIMQIFFGATGLVRHLFSGVWELAGGARAFTPAGAQAAAPPDVEALLRARVPHYEAMVYGGLIVGLVSGAVCIASGIGLLRLRPWARWLTIGYACYFIISELASFIYALTVLQPLVNQMVAEQALQPNIPVQGAMAFNVAMKITSIAPYLSLVLLPYPVVLLTVMFLPSVREAFRSRASARAEDKLGLENADDEAEDA
jgi:hypothetical protein